jgi:hypothetical protein
MEFVEGLRLLRIIVISFTFPYLLFEFLLFIFFSCNVQQLKLLNDAGTLLNYFFILGVLLLGDIRKFVPRKLFIFICKYIHAIPITVNGVDALVQF